MNSQALDLFRAHVEILAYQFWEERGRPSGSPEVDWFRAERELRHRLRRSFLHHLDSSAGLPFSSISMGPIEH